MEQHYPVDDPLIIHERFDGGDILSSFFK